MLKKVLPSFCTSTCAVTVGRNSQSPSAPSLSGEWMTSDSESQLTSTEAIFAAPFNTRPLPSGLATPAASSEATAGRYLTFEPGFVLTSRDRKITASVWVPSAASLGTRIVSATRNLEFGGTLSTSWSSDDHGAAEPGSVPGGLNCTSLAVLIV